MTTLHGGWAPAASTNPSEHRTHYPRASHYNQSFRIGEGYPTSSVTKRPTADMPGANSAVNPAHIRTQANTFAINSNSIASNSSQIFEQTQSSNGFGSTFLSGGGQASGQAFRQQHMRTS